MSTHKASARLAWALCVLLTLASVGFHWAHDANIRYVADVAHAVDDGRVLSDSMRVCTYVEWAHDHLRWARQSELHPWPVRLYYMLNPLHPGAADVIRYGADYRGPCGSYSRVLHTMLSAGGMRSRILLLRDDSGRSIHTVVEAVVAGRWIVADPSSGIVFHRRDGRLATRGELAADPAWLHAQTDTVAKYDPAYDYDSTTLFNWEKIPVLLPTVRWLLVLVLGEQKVAGITRPEIWMWPREAMAALCLVGALAMALVARRVERRASAAAVERSPSGSSS